MRFRHRHTAASLIAAIALGAFYLTRWQGLLIPVRIAGGSMAESLVGDHFRRICDDCRFPCRYDAALLPRARQVMCPNCGALNIHPPDGVIERGDRVGIDRWVYRWRRPARWEVVAFRSPGQDHSLGVKRIVGLPGEVLEFRQGQVYANGRMIRKSLAQLRDVAQRVHDQRYTSEAADPVRARWQPEPGARWQPVYSGFQLRPAEGKSVGSSGDFQWLAYHHRLGGWAERGATAPIWDSYAYNQGLSRQLYQVTDVLLVGNLIPEEPGGQVAWEVQGAGKRYRVVVDIGQRRATLFRNRQRVHGSDLPVAALRSGTQFELAWCDGQLLFSLGGRQVFRFCDPSVEEAGAVEAEWEETRAVFRMGARGGAWVVDRLQVYRDLYYLEPRSTDQPWKTPYQLADNSFFVVGDNIPISRDSRHLGVLPKEKLLGPVRKKPNFLVLRRLTGRRTSE